jgi:hypothetical protein
MNFADALNTHADDVKRPPMLPKGNYVWTIKKQPIFGNAGPEWETCEFQCSPVRALQDIDADLLEQFTAHGPIDQVQVRKSFMFPKDEDKKRDWEQALATLTEFLVIDLGVTKASLKEMLANSQNRQFIGALDHRKDTKSENVFHEIRKTAPVS